METKRVFLVKEKQRKYQYLLREIDSWYSLYRYRTEECTPKYWKRWFYLKQIDRELRGYRLSNNSSNLQELIVR